MTGRSVADGAGVVTAYVVTFLMRPVVCGSPTLIRPASVVAAVGLCVQYGARGVRRVRRERCARSARVAAGRRRRASRAGRAHSRRRASGAGRGAASQCRRTLPLRHHPSFGCFFQAAIILRVNSSELGRGGATHSATECRIPNVLVLAIFGASTQLPRGTTLASLGSARLYE